MNYLISTESEFSSFFSFPFSQGYVVRDFHIIARQYLRSWFFPDLAGSFPFDKVVTAAIQVQYFALLWP